MCKIIQHLIGTSILKQTSLRQFEIFFLVSCRFAGAILTIVLIPSSQTHSSKLEVFPLNEFYVFYFAIVSATCHFQKLRDSNNQSSSNLGLGGWMGVTAAECVKWMEVTPSALKFCGSCDEAPQLLNLHQFCVPKQKCSTTDNCSKQYSFKSRSLPMCLTIGSHFVLLQGINESGID